MVQREGNRNWTANEEVSALLSLMKGHKRNQGPKNILWLKVFEDPKKELKNVHSDFQLRRKDAIWGKNLLQVEQISLGNLLLDLLLGELGGWSRLVGGEGGESLIPAAGTPG